MEEEIQEIKAADLPPPVPEKLSRKLLFVFLGAALILIVFIFSVALPLFAAYRDGQKAVQLVQAVKDASKISDIKKTTEAITAAKKQVVKVRADLAPLAWTKFVPVLGNYPADIIHLAAAGQYGLEAAEILSQAVEPYADILGLKGQGTFTGGTAEDRITKAVETLDKVTPQIDEIARKINLVKSETDQINPSRYPQTIRSRIEEIKGFVTLADELLSQARPMVKELPDLLGVKGERKYLVLFQNDAELRPTGGFITAYAVFRIEKGRIHLDSADDIYKLDDTLTKHVAPPDPIARYLLVYGWRLRDANFSPDFFSSMKTFEDLYAFSTDKKKIDGIIAVDTQVLLKLLDVLGGVSVYGTNFTIQKVSGCDCPMVIYELEKFADEPKEYARGSRKDIIGVLLSEVLKKALASPRQVYGPLTQAMLEQARQKHILFYLHSGDAQKGVEALGFAGRIKNPASDFLHVNDTNLGGAKSNLYVQESVVQEIATTAVGADITLTINYKYPHSADNCSLERKGGLCLAGIYRDYLRVYLPKAATIDSVTGFENKSRTFEDLDHLVVDGYFTVVPQGLAKIQVKYKVPGDFSKNRFYQLLIQKQPGTDANRYKVVINGKAQEFGLLEDKEVSAKL